MNMKNVVDKSSSLVTGVSQSKQSRARWAMRVVDVGWGRWGLPRWFRMGPFFKIQVGPIHILLEL